MHAPGSKLGPVGARVSSEPEVAAAGKEVRAVMVGGRVAEGLVDAPAVAACWDWISARTSALIRPSICCNIASSPARLVWVPLFVWVLDEVFVLLVPASDTSLPLVG